jgi:hypothetical protein
MKELHPFNPFAHLHSNKPFNSPQKSCSLAPSSLERAEDIGRSDSQQENSNVKFHVTGNEGLCTQIYKLKNKKII